MQNKFHYAISAWTAAELIEEKADHHQPHMGLTIWKHAPSGRILSSDVSVAKNYLSLELLMSMTSKRLNQGLTQAKLAETSGVPRTTISKIESGSRNTNH